MNLFDAKTNLAQRSNVPFHYFEQALACSVVSLDDKIILFFLLLLSFIFFIFADVTFVCAYPGKENKPDKFHKPVQSYRKRCHSGFTSSRHTLIVILTKCKEEALILEAFPSL